MKPFITTWVDPKHIILNEKSARERQVLYSVWFSCLGHVQLFATLWTTVCQAPPSMGFPRQEYWSGLPFPSPRDLPDSGIKPAFPALQADSVLLSHKGSP